MEDEDDQIDILGSEEDGAVSEIPAATLDPMQLEASKSVNDDIQANGDHGEQSASGLDGESEVTGSDVDNEEDDMEADAAAQAMAEELGDALFADITKAFSNSIAPPVDPITFQPDQEDQILSIIGKILDYVAQDGEIEGLFESKQLVHALTDSPNGSQPTENFLLALKNILSAGTVETDTAIALIEVLKGLVEEDELQESEDEDDTWLGDADEYGDDEPDVASPPSGGKRKRSVTDEGIKIEDED